MLVSISTTLAYSGSPEREPAPRFRAKTMDGQQYSNESLRGKVVLLEFWTTWCQYCRAEEELVNQVHQEFSGKGLVVLAVDVGESKKTVKKYLAENKRTCPIVLTEDTNLAAMYQANSYPIYVVIDREGYIVATQRGAAGERALRSMLSRAGMKAEESEE